MHLCGIVVGSCAGMTLKFLNKVSSYKREDHFKSGNGKDPRSLDSSCLIAPATGDLRGSLFQLIQPICLYHAYCLYGGVIGLSCGMF